MGVSYKGRGMMSLIVLHHRSSKRSYSLCKSKLYGFSRSLSMYDSHSSIQITQSHCYLSENMYKSHYSRGRWVDEVYTPYWISIRKPQA